MTNTPSLTSTAESLPMIQRLRNALATGVEYELESVVNEWDSMVRLLGEFDLLRDQVARLERELAVSEGVGSNAFKCAQELLAENLALKSKAAPLDVEAVMRLVDAYCDLRIERHVGDADGKPVDRKANTVASDAAREALRAALVAKP